MWNLPDGIAKFSPAYFAKSKQIVYFIQKTENNVAKLENFAAGEILDTFSLPDINKRFPLRAKDKWQARIIPFPTPGIREI